MMLSAVRRLPLQQFGIACLTHYSPSIRPIRTVFSRNFQHSGKGSRRACPQLSAIDAGTAAVFVYIVKWSGLFYDIRYNGPGEGTPTSLYRGLNRPPPKASSDGLGLGTAAGRKDYGLPVDQRQVSQLGQCR